ncbi:uncharacterized protein KIAA0825 homolog [Patiria miniata]|uniref:Uncharacterized protein n=1 Tax=Patiria miniata TaxID=46514 RepID=A0A914BP02_PATMI|nr:uncharacterized protein KIAA0825 homolog [Patiria miniata]
MSNARSSPLCSLPSVSAMFKMGPPCLQTLHAAMEDIDRQLSENDKSIEDTLRCLVQATNSLSADNDYTNIKDAMDSLLHTPVLEECACLSPEPEDVGVLLRTILKHLTTNPGCELTTFRQLLYLSSHEGLGLPIRAPEPDHMTQSAMSLNTVADAADESNDLLWEDIRSRLRRFFFERLQQLPVRPRDAGLLDLHGKQRVEYLQSLCILYPVRKVWSSYQLLRSQQVSTVIQDVMTPSLSDESITEAAEPKPATTLDQLAMRLPKLVVCLEGMIEADFTVMLANVFDGQVEAAQALREIYLCSLSEELQTLLERAWEVKGQEAKAEKKKKTTGKRMVGSVVGSSLFGDEDEMEDDMDSEGVEVDISIEDLPPLTQDELVHLVTITEQLSGMDAYIHALHQQASRDSSAMLKHGRPKGSIKSALKHTRDPSSRDTSHRGEYTGRRGVLPDAIPPPFGVTPGMMTPETTAQRRHHILDSPASQIKWEWSSILEGVVSDVCTSLPSLVKNVCQSALQQEEMMHAQTQTVHMVPVCGDLVNSFSEYPRSVSKSLIDLVSFLDTILPLAVNGAEGVMKPLRAAYVEAVTASMGHYFRKISNIFGTVASPTKSSYTNIVEKYKLLSIASFATSHLTYYGDVLGDDESRHSLGTVKKQYSELVTSLKGQILDYQDHVISTIVLQDAESHHWGDQRPFYEDERCSFSVQMWHLHLDALRRELFSICPPGLAQEIFGEVVNRSLALLAQRYNRAKPSYKRTRQYRADITALLLITLDHLWYLCPSPGPLLDPLSTHHPVSPIHNSCTCLLSALAVVGSPLGDLYRVYRKGFSQRKAGGGMERTISEQEAVEGSSGLLSLAMSSSREWLRWIRPGLFDGLQKGMDNLPDKQAAFIQLKLLCNQPCPKYPLLLQAVLMRNCLVPTLMVTNTGPTQSQTSRLNSLSAYDGCSGGICPGKPCRSYQSQDIPDVVQPIVDLLALCGDQPNALTTVLMAMIEKEDIWECFEASCLPGKTLPVPLWLASVYKLISSYIDRAIKPALAVLLRDPVDPKHQVGFIDSVKELPCGCRLKQKAQIIKATGPQEDILTAMQVLITSLADNVGALPTPLCVFFNSLQQHLNEKEVHCTHDCIGLQVIASSLYNRLCDQEMLVELAGLPIGSQTYSEISQFGDYCYQVLTSSTAKCRDSLPQPVYTFMGCHTDWLHSKIDTIISHMDNELFVNCSGYPLEEAPSEFLEHYRQMQASLILQAPDGEKYLLQVYNMLTNNLDWFEHQLEIPPVFPSKDPSSSPTNPKESPIFSLDLTKSPAHSHTHAQPFQPLACFNTLNGAQFDQTALAEFPFNWPRLLQCELGMSEVGFRTLLSHRHEMQEDAYLEEAEKKPVHILRSKYNLEVAELV